MAWIESDIELGDHPKTHALAESLGISIAQAVGHLHLLWYFTMKYAWRDGNLEKFVETAIAKGSKWEGQPKDFIKALQTSGFMDGLKIHDWLDCAGKFVLGRLYNEERRKTAQNGALLRKSTATYRT